MVISQNFATLDPKPYGFQIGRGSGSQKRNISTEDLIFQNFATLNPKRYGNSGAAAEVRYQSLYVWAIGLL